jgi:N-acetylneuraminic acid mutarotase
LIVAGGANFPDKMPWEGGRKTWHEKVFVLDNTNATWRSAGPLPRAVGYGVSVTTPGGVLCIGGSDAAQHVQDVYLLSLSRGEIELEVLPSLPEPLANSCGALVGQTVYVAGGTTTPDATNTLHSFWALDRYPHDRRAIRAADFGVSLGIRCAESPGRVHRRPLQPQMGDHRQPNTAPPGTAF